jgi:hypothetical protein
MANVKVKGSPSWWFSLSDIPPTIRLFLLMIVPVVAEFLYKFFSEHKEWTWEEFLAAVVAAITAAFTKFVKDTRKVTP